MTVVVVEDLVRLNGASSGNCKAKNKCSSLETDKLSRFLRLFRTLRGVGVGILRGIATPELVAV